MIRKFVILIVAVNLLVLAFGGFIVYHDLYLREYGRRNHVNTQVIEVEHCPLGYRPICARALSFPKTANAAAESAKVANTLP